MASSTDLEEVSSQGRVWYGVQMAFSEKHREGAGGRGKERYRAEGGGNYFPFLFDTESLYIAIL